VTFEKGDEMDCLVRGCNFLQTSVPREAFTFRDGTPTYLDKGECAVEYGFPPLKHEQHVLQICLEYRRLHSTLELPGIVTCSEWRCVPIPSCQHWVGRQHCEGMAVMCTASCSLSSICVHCFDSVCIPHTSNCRVVPTAADVSCAGVISNSGGARQWVSPRRRHICRAVSAADGRQELRRDAAAGRAG
jgi:hypothetical protein